MSFFSVFRSNLIFFQNFCSYFSGLFKYYFTSSLNNIFIQENGFQKVNNFFKGVYYYTQNSVTFWNIFLVVFIQFNFYLYNFFNLNMLVIDKTNNEINYGPVTKTIKNRSGLYFKLNKKNVEIELLYFFNIIKYFLKKNNLLSTQIKFFYNKKLFIYFFKLTKKFTYLFKHENSVLLFRFFKVYMLELKFKKMTRIILKFNKIAQKIIKKIYIQNPFILKNINIKKFLFVLKTKVFLLSERNLIFVKFLQKVTKEKAKLKKGLSLIKKKIIYFKVQVPGNLLQHFFFKNLFSCKNIKNINLVQKKNQFFFNSQKVYGFVSKKKFKILYPIFYFKYILFKTVIGNYKKQLKKNLLFVVSIVPVLSKYIIINKLCSCNFKKYIIKKNYKNTIQKNLKGILKNKNMHITKINNVNIMNKFCKVNVINKINKISKIK